MKTIGMMGGMSWESSLEYYRIINETVHKRLGGYHSAKSVMVSVDFAEIESKMQPGLWENAGNKMVEAARAIEAAGAHFLIICTNTMHNQADLVSSSIHIPLIHIADAAGEKITEMNLKKIGLLGTRFTMEQDFYRQRLADRFGLDVLIPETNDRQIIHEVIFNELVMGTIRDDSKQAYLQIINQLVEAGAQGIILGCTEIGMLVKQADCTIPLFDTTILHAEAAVEYALKD